MRSGRASIICALSLLGGLALGCSSGGEVPEPPAPDTGPPEVDPGVLRVPFLVEDYFVPNGCFGDADCASSVLSVNGRGCDGGQPPSGQGPCRRYQYSPLAQGAAGYKGYLGILFQDVGPDGENEIGKVPGLPVEPGAKRVVFWAKVKSGSTLVSFRAGGANNWEGETDPSLPYRDEFAVPQDVTLDRTFQQVTIDLQGVTYEEVVSPFGWAIESAGSTEPIELYISDLRWE